MDAIWLYSGLQFESFSAHIIKILTATQQSSASQDTLRARCLRRAPEPRQNASGPAYK